MESGSKSANDDRSFHLQISNLSGKDSDLSFSAPQTGTPNKKKTNGNADYVCCSSSSSRRAVDAPEKKLTLFALRVALLEKIATHLGTLGFIWATVVLLGGFATTLEKTDFWFITIILLIEGTRIFSRSRELEWQHEATWRIADAGVSRFRTIMFRINFLYQAAKSVFNRSRRSSHQGRRETAENVAENGNKFWEKRRLPGRTWTNLDVPLLPYAPCVFLSRNVGQLLHWLQLLFAICCVVLSMLRLVENNFGEVVKGDTEKRNRKSALIIFYALASGEAILFLLEKTYWEWEITICKLLETVNKDCGFPPKAIVSTRRFFYDAYSKCLYGSIFDGLKMDMVSYGMELVGSASVNEQMIGAGILRQFATHELFSDETLKKIGNNITVIERLVEMLNWKHPEEEKIRRSAAELLSRLASKKQNSLRVAGIPGAMESISSLLCNDRTRNGAYYEFSEKCIISDGDDYEYSTFIQLGLLLLKELARDHDNSAKIGTTRGLLTKIIDFAHTEEMVLKNADAASSQIRIVKLSLQLVKCLVSTTCRTGEYLRREISEIVFTISSIRDILRHGENQPKLQKLGIEIFTSLALDLKTAEKIGSTGGVLKELFNIFFKEGLPENQMPVQLCAGEALSTLALECKGNCLRIVKLGVVEKIFKALEDPLIRIHAARILRNLYAYAGNESINQLNVMKAAASIVLKGVFSEEIKLQEAMIGLAVHIFRFMTSEESSIVFARAGIAKTELANELVQILKRYPSPPIKIPRIRRFTIELVIWMMEEQEANIQVFKDLGLEMELYGVLDTTDEIGNFNIFSGTFGKRRHKTPIDSLVKYALKLLS